MKKHTAWAKGLALLACISILPAQAQDEDGIETLQREIAAMRAEQRAIRQDLAEIRKLLEGGGSEQRQQRERPRFKPRDLEIGDSFVIGPANAPITMFSYSDYHCPYCRRHANDVLPELISKHAKAGKLRIVMREMPIASLHPRAGAAAQAALCADRQGQYLAMHDALFAERKRHSDDDLKALGETLGLDQGDYEACLQDEAVSSRIQADINEGRSMNITGTPGFVMGLTNPDNPGTVNGELYVNGARPLEHFEAAMAALLEPDEETEAESGSDAQEQAGK